MHAGRSVPGLPQTSSRLQFPSICARMMRQKRQQAKGMQPSCTTCSSACGSPSTGASLCATDEPFAHGNKVLSPCDIRRMIRLANGFDHMAFRRSRDPLSLPALQLSHMYSSVIASIRLTWISASLHDFCSVFQHQTLTYCHAVFA